jgi:hypothetical protein
VRKHATIPVAEPFASWSELNKAWVHVQRETEPAINPPDCPLQVEFGRTSSVSSPSVEGDTSRQVCYPSAIVPNWLAFLCVAFRLLSLASSTTFHHTLFIEALPTVRLGAGQSQQSPHRTWAKPESDKRVPRRSQRQRRAASFAKVKSAAFNKQIIANRESLPATLPPSGSSVQSRPLRQSLSPRLAAIVWLASAAKTRFRLRC